MFLPLFTHHQQKMLLTLARQLVLADGKVDNKEKQVIESLVREMGHTEFFETYEDAQIPQLFPEPKDRLRVLLELILLGHGDGQYGPDEQQFVQKIQDILEIPEPKRQQLEAWCDRMMQIQQDLAGILNE
jgi:uncharacterized tellurite resistance protein B-like protein